MIDDWRLAIDSSQGATAKSSSKIATRQCQFAAVPMITRRFYRFELVYVDPAEPSEEIRQHLHDFGYHIAALRDNEHALVKMTGAKVTPEAAVFVPAPSGAPGDLVGTGRMVYRGRIDDQYVDFGKT